MKLPLLISVPHAGLTVPPEVKDHCILTPQQVARDGDEGAAQIYNIEDRVAHYVTTRVARAIVDVNRAVDDRRPDGVVKTHTCWNERVYEPFPPESLIDALLQRYYHPYHQRLAEVGDGGLRLAVDCHTMAEFGPPIGPDPGAPRPLVCLSNARHTCPQHTLDSLAGCFERAFETQVAINQPFLGGYIVRTYALRLPWVQLELNRSAVMSVHEKRERLLAALADWCRA